MPKIYEQYKKSDEINRPNHIADANLFLHFSRNIYSKKIQTRILFVIILNKNVDLRHSYHETTLDSYIKRFF